MGQTPSYLERFFKVQDSSGTFENIVAHCAVLVDVLDFNGGLGDSFD